MSTEQLAIVLRTIVLTGSVLFAFALLFFGFRIVLREYQHLNTWPKMKEFLQLSSEAGLEADITKGTLALNRTTPGILLIAIGTALICLCIFQKLEYTSRDSGAIPDGKSTTNADTKNLSFNQGVSQALQDLDERISILEKQVIPGSKNTGAVQPAASKDVTGFPFVFASAQVKEQTTIPVDEPRSISSNPANGTDSTILNKWLSSVPKIKGKPITEQIKFLLDKWGDVPVNRHSLLLDRAKTPDQIALEEYGASAFSTLLLCFNPNLPQDGKPIPKYTHVAIYLPSSAPVSKYRREVTIKIGGMSRAQVYDRVLEMVHGIMETTEYQKDPAYWWQQTYPELGPVEFAKSLNIETGRQWGIRQVPSEEGESLELLAKIHFGDRKYANILKFINYGTPNIISDLKKPLPERTQVVILHLIEF